MVRAGEVKFPENVIPPPYVTFQVPHVMCHVSHVSYHMSNVTCKYCLLVFFYKVAELVSGGSVINGAYPV